MTPSNEKPMAPKEAAARDRNTERRWRVEGASGRTAEIMASDEARQRLAADALGEPPLYWYGPLLASETLSKREGLTRTFTDTTDWSDSLLALPAVGDIIDTALYNIGDGSGYHVTQAIVTKVEGRVVTSQGLCRFDRAAWNELPSWIQDMRENNG